MISHYVVCYDHETEEIYLDGETENAIFPDGNVWDTEKNIWIFPIPSTPVYIKGLVGFDLVDAYLKIYRKEG